MRRFPSVLPRADVVRWSRYIPLWSGRAAHHGAFCASRLLDERCPEHDHGARPARYSPSVTMGAAPRRGCTRSARRPRGPTDRAGPCPNRIGSPSVARTGRARESHRSGSASAPARTRASSDMCGFPPGCIDDPRRLRIVDVIEQEQVDARGGTCRRQCGFHFLLLVPMDAAMQGEASSAIVSLLF